MHTRCIPKRYGMHFLHFSLRYISKARGGNFTRVISLTLGLTVSLVLFSYVSYLLSFDRCFPHHERMYQVWIVNERGPFQGIYAPFAPAIQAYAPQIERATRLFKMNKRGIMVGEQYYEAEVIVADTAFLDFFGIQQTAGAEARQILSVPGQVMVSQSLANAMFPNTNPIGQQVMYEANEPKTICGIFADPPAASSLGAFTFLLPFAELEKWAQGWNGGGVFNTYLMLKEGTHVSEVEALLPAFLAKHHAAETMNGQVVLKPISQATFVYGDNVKKAWLLSAIALLMVVVAALNYVLVSLSGMVNRSRTIALLKCNGAHKKNIFTLFLHETFLLSGIALLLSILLILGMAKPISQLTGYSLSALFDPHRIWAPLVVLILSYLLSALLPALLFTRVPIQAAFTGYSDSRKVWKRLLLGLEIGCVTFAIALLTAISFTVYGQLHKDLGYEHDQLLYISLPGGQTEQERHIAELSNLPEVNTAALAVSLPIWGMSGQPCYDNVTRELLFECRWEVADSNYVNTMGIQIVEGENFSHRSRWNSVLVNQEYVRLRGWTDSPIGHTIVDKKKGTDTYTIIGVVQDFYNDGLTQVLPLVIHPIPEYLLFMDGVKDPDNASGITYSDWNPRTLVRMNNLNQASLAAVQTLIKTYESTNNHRIDVYDDLIYDSIAQERSYRNILLLSGIVTLLIALIGLIGYLTDEVNRRSREIRLRKIHGATTKDILLLLTKNTLSLYLIAIGIGLLSAYAVGKHSVGFITTTNGTFWVLFLGSGLAVLLLVFIIQTLKTWRIANSNPVDIQQTLFL